MVYTEALNAGDSRRSNQQAEGVPSEYRRVNCAAHHLQTVELGSNYSGASTIVLLMYRCHHATLIRSGELGMLYFGTILITLAMVLIVTTIGLPVCQLFPFKLRAIARGYFSPLLGLSVVILIAIANGWLSHFRQSVCVAVTVLLLLVSIRPGRLYRRMGRLLVTILCFAIIASLPILLPVRHYDAFNPFNDAFTYIEHGQWLQTHSFSERVVPSGYRPAETQVALYQHQGSRMGASFFLAWLQALFGLEWSYYAYLPAVLTPLIAGSLAVGGAVALILRKQRKVPRLIAVAMATTLNGWVFGASYGFFPQTFGLAFTIGSIALVSTGAVVSLPRRAHPRTRQPKHEPAIDIGRASRESLPAALCLASLAHTYNDILAFVVVGTIAFFVLIGLFYHGHIRRLLLFVAAIAVETFLLVNYEFIRILRNFLHTVLGVGSGTVTLGWPVRWKVWEFAAHAIGLKSPDDNIWLFGFESLTLIALVLILGACMYAAFQGLRKRTLPVEVVLYILVLGVFVAGFLYFRYMVHGTHPAEIGHTFVQFKLSKWVSPLAFVLVGVTAGYYVERHRRFGQFVLTILLVCAPLGIFTNYLAGRINTVDFLNKTGYPRAGFSALLSLRQMVLTLPPDQVIYINPVDEMQKVREMIGYVLPDRKLASDYSDDGYLAGTLGPAEVTSRFEDSDWLLDFAPAGRTDQLAHARAGNLILFKRPAYLLTLRTVSDGYDRESDGIDWWYWSSGKLTFKFRSMGEAPASRLRFQYVPTALGRTMSMHVQSNHPMDLTFRMEGGQHTYISPPVDLSGPDVTVTLRSDGAPVRLSATDPRLAAFRIMDLEVVDSADIELVSTAGGYARENEGKSWRHWTSKELVFRYNIPPNLRAAVLKFVYVPAVPGSLLNIEVASETTEKVSLKMAQGWNTYTSPPIRTIGPNATVRFSTPARPVPISATDTRTVVFLIQNLQLMDAGVSKLCAETSH